MPMKLIAIEKNREIKRAVKDWKLKFSDSTEHVEAMGGTVYRNDNLGVWGFFGGIDGRYWNAFGRTPHNFRKNILVEINPPQEGINTNVQGIVARDADGARWMLHQGRLHPSKTRISQEMFAEVSESERGRVTFSNGTSIICNLVANIDAPAEVVKNQTANFIFDCDRVRLHYTEDEKAAASETRLLQNETECFPELQGSYVVSGQDTRVAQRSHADVWHALAKELTKRSIRHTNARVARHGPDLRTLESKPVLFEIKSDLTASDIQTGVGQLLLYEQLLKAPHRKVIVLPSTKVNALLKILSALDISVLTYKRNGRSVVFNLHEIRTCLS